MHIGAIGLGPWIGWYNAFLPAVSVLLAWELRLGLVRTGRKDPRRYMLGFGESDIARVALPVLAVSFITTVVVLAILTPRHGFERAIPLALPLFVTLGLSLLLAVACVWRARARPGSRG